jgi:hypothetical protein
MATERELTAIQNERLYDLLELKKECVEQEIKLALLDKKIRRAISVMSEKDIAWVEKSVGYKIEQI